MNPPNTPPKGLLPPLLIALFLAMTAAGAVAGGVVSNYKVNGKTVHEGAPFGEFHAIAGEPRAIAPVAGNERSVEWVYLCEGSGADRCKVVADDGRREMRARFSNGRLKLIRFERI